VIPVFQTTVDKEKGDCLRAALASILELKLEDVPHLRLLGENWFETMYSFLWDNGYEFHGSKYGTDILTYDKGVKGYYIVQGKSRTYPDCKHNVVFKDGKMVHDPNPSNKGLATIEDCWMIEPKKKGNEQ
jgi:hypothetical protein